MTAPGLQRRFAARLARSLIWVSCPLAALGAGWRRRRRGFACGWLQALALSSIISAAWPALAIPLPAPIVDATAHFNLNDPGQRIQTFGLLDHTIDPGSSLQFFSAGTQVLRASADVGPLVIPAIRFGTVSGFLRFSFEIVGPDCAGADACVPVDVTASGHVAGVAGNGGVFVATSRWSLRNTSEITLVGDSISVFFDGVGGGGSDDDAFDADHPIMLHTNREYRVVMEAIAQGGTGINGVGFGRALAFVDPIFRFGAGIDPARFGFRFSDGITNALPQPAPEPGALALASLALAALGACRRRGALGPTQPPSARRFAAMIVRSPPPQQATAWWPARRGELQAPGPEPSA